MGQQNIDAFLGRQRDAYKFIHDQSLRTANRGYTMTEIGERVKLPPALAGQWDLRDYYGTVNHNAKAVYQRYRAGTAANPDLHPAAARGSGQALRAVHGRRRQVLAQARESYAQGDYRWVAEVVKHVVFADPDNRAARKLEADALEQLGYRAESASWRSAYLMGARELRNGVQRLASTQSASPDMVQAMTDPMFLDYRRCAPERRARRRPHAQDQLGPARYRQALRSRWRTRCSATRPTSSMPMPGHADRAACRADRRAAGPDHLREAVGAGRAKIEGDPGRAAGPMGMLDNFDPQFEIVAP